MTELLDHLGRPRVAVTGMAALTPLGNDLATSWAAALSGASGIARVTAFDVSDLPCQIGGEVKGFDPTAHMERKEARRVSRVVHFAIAAWRAATADAGLPEQAPDPEQTGVIMGTSIGGLDVLDEALEVVRTRGWRRVNPFALTSSLANMPAHHISVAATAYGPLNTVVAACASGVQALGEAAECIRRGAAETMIAGGAEAIIHPGAFHGFAAMRAMPTNYNGDPARASRPFDARREGFVLSEGCGVLILERLDRALARGATVHAELIGHASSADAHHMAAPDPTAAGAVRAMRRALHDAGLPPSAVEYINAHGTSTPLNDKGETLAVKTLFGEAARRVPISSTKSIMGHAMGAAGAIETIFCIKALQTGVLPPTWNYEEPDPDCDLDYVPNTPRRTDPAVAMCNAFGLGGQNASLIVRRYPPFAQPTGNPA